MIDEKKETAASMDGTTEAEPERDHPFDKWLIRELKSLYADTRHEPLPDELSDLATQLEQKLKSARNGPAK